jgi:HD-GYP domain-containing protein (c-di-GMP phosphodiesterase class II)
MRLPGSRGSRSTRSRAGTANDDIKVLRKPGPLTGAEYDEIKRHTTVGAGIIARILLVADAFGAMTSDRSYRRARPYHAAIEELERHAGTQFDPTGVAALPTVLSRGLPPSHRTEIRSATR